MNTRVLWVIILVLAVVIVAMAWILFATPAPAHAPTVATTTPATTPTSTSPEPMHTKVTVNAPLPNATVGKTFSVSGNAPGPWYFEATFPIQVRDKDGNLLAATHADAQTDWMTTGLVPFQATVNITDSYKGPATLILLKDNPSGLPENEDALEVSIVIQ